MLDTDFVDRARAIVRPDAASLGTDNLSITSPDAGVADQITITVLPTGMAIVEPACEDVLRPILTYQEMTFRRKGSDQVSRVRMTVSAYSVKDERLLISHGCVSRVKRCLEQHGHHVTIIDHRAPDPHFDLATASQVVDTEGRFPGLAARLRARREGIIEVETGRQQSEMIAAMCLLSPQTKFLIACRTIDAAQELAENLRPYLVNEVEAVHGHNWSYSCRVVCCTFGSLDRSNPREWDVLIFADAFDGAQKTNELARGEYVRRRVYALVAPSRPRSQTDQLLFEALAGEVIYRDPKCRQKVRQNLSVAFATHSSPSISEQPSPLARHMSLRTDVARNRSIAELAMTLSSGKPSSDWNLERILPDTTGQPSPGSKPGVAKTEYDGLGNTTKLIAYNGSSSVAEDTVYLYEDAISSSRNTSTIYPDSSDSTSSGSDQIKVTYNVDGRVSQRTDQRGTVLAYGYDNRRRPQSQKTTTLGGSTDGAVRSITKGYDSLGRKYKITSHGNQTDDPDNTTDIKNQVVYTFNDLGNITKSEQSHSGAVGGGTPSVQYAYDTSAVSSVFDDGVRLESITYPDGRVLFYDYSTSEAIEDRVGVAKRLRETNGSSSTLVEYSHTGGNRKVLTDYQQPDLKLGLFGGTSSTYDGLDRFGRIIDHRWYNYTSGTADRARYAYGYDLSGSRTWKEDSVAASSSVNQDEFFTYDGLRLLKTADRGDLNGGKTAISTLTFGQGWDQDQLANWSSFTQDNDGNGTNDLSQNRTHNDANEISQIDASATHVAHDAAGSMTKVSKPANWSAHYDLTWDAWNRLVKVADGANTVAEYQYDGENRRIVKKIYSGGSLSQTRHMYLSLRNQVLEERIDSSTTADRQFTWGSRYIDDLILRTRDTDANGSLDETVYALQDANWNITALADTSGAVIERFVYTPYGHSTVLDANFATDSDGVSDVGWEYRFTSREYDSETGLHYFRARYFHDGLGRFISRDPLVYPDGYNTYAAWFAPGQLDPTGMQLGVFGEDPDAGSQGDIEIEMPPNDHNSVTMSNDGLNVSLAYFPIKRGKSCYKKITSYANFSKEKITLKGACEGASVLLQPSVALDGITSADAMGCLKGTCCQTSTTRTVKKNATVTLPLPTTSPACVGFWTAKADMASTTQIGSCRP